MFNELKEEKMPRHIFLTSGYDRKESGKPFCAYTHQTECFGTSMCWKEEDDPIHLKEDNDAVFNEQNI